MKQHIHRGFGNVARPLLCTCAAWLAASLAGCGGGAIGPQASSPPFTATAPAPVAAGDSPAGDQRKARSAAAKRSAAASADSIHDPLAMPIDYGARTRAGLYLRRSAAERVERERQGRVIWIDTACCTTEEEVELVTMRAYAELAARDLVDDDPPFFVAGGDQRLAARLADRLLNAGIKRAYLVTP